MIESDEADFGSPATGVFQGSCAWNRPAVVDPPEPVDAELDAAEVAALADAEVDPPLPPTVTELSPPAPPPLAEVDAPLAPVVVDETDVAALDDVTAPVPAAPELACVDDALVG
jgi:hypothetical protein